MGTNKKFLIFLLFVLFSYTYASDYEKTYDCTSVNDNDLNNISLHYIDTIYFLTVGPIALILCFGFLLFLLFNREIIKVQPGDLYFGATLAEMILTIHWILSGAQSIYEKLEDYSPPQNDSTFCQSNAFVSFFAGTWEMVYNIFFCIYLIQTIRNFLNPVEYQKIYYHVFSFILSFVITMVLGLTGHLGKNIFGTCSLVANSSVAFLGPVVLLIYYIFAFYAIFYFKNYLPNNSSSTNKEKYLQYYYKYIIVTSLIWIPVAVINIISALNCRYFHENLVDIALTIGNINKLNTPIALTLLRMYDPFIRLKMNDFFRNLSGKNSKNANVSIFINSEKNFTKKDDLFTILLEKNPTINQNVLTCEEMDEHSPNKENDKSEKSDSPSRKTSNLTYNSKKKMESENDLFDKEEKESAESWLSSLTEFAKLVYIKAIIIGVLANVRRIRDRKDSNAFSFFNLTDFSEKTQKKKLEKNLVFNLDNEIIKNELPDMWDEDLQNINMEIKYFSPKLFDELLLNDLRFIDLNTSLSIDSNLEQIKNSSKADGGRGGQFFFFSFDNQIILKSLSGDDFKCMTKIIKPYYEYMVKNRNSLITKIYGVYQFKFFNNNKKKSCIFSQKIMIMRNLCCYPKYFVERIYDLKGSTFERESLKKKNIKQGSILKDIDFLKIEKKIYIEEKYKLDVIETLKKDSIFFKDNGIIDYSLLVIKINLQTDQNDCEYLYPFMPLRDNTSKVDGLWSLNSTKDPNVKYHIGIIDYLQLYNYKKILEKYTKKLIKANINLDTSAQSPHIYSDRFCKFIEKILSNNDERDENKND